MSFARQAMTVAAEWVFDKIVKNRGFAAMQILTNLQICQPYGFVG